MSDDAVSVLVSVADLLCSLDREGTAELVRAIGMEYIRKEAEIKRLRERLAAAEAVLERCKIAVIDADSEMSAYGHGRPLDKESALRVSGMCRRSYGEIVAWLLGAAKAGGGDGEGR